MKKKPDFSLKGLHRNGIHVLIDINFNTRIRLTTNLLYPEELWTAYNVRNDLIVDLEKNNYKTRNYQCYINNLKSLEKYDEELMNEKENPTMETLFEDSLSVMKVAVNRGEMSDEYRDTHVYNIKNHLLPFFADLKVKEINAPQILDFIEKLNKNFTKETAKGILKPLSRALNLAVARGILVMSPMKALPSNKLSKFKTNYEKNTTTFSVKEVTIIIDSIESIELRNATAFLLWTACRPCEVFALKVEDIDMVKKEIYIGKSKSRKQNIRNTTKNGGTRIIQVFEPLVPYLVSQLEICENQVDKTLFKAPRGKPWRHSSHFGIFWKKSFDKLEGKIEYKNLYKLRSAFITFLHRKKIPTGKIAKFAGHLKIATTNRYIQFIKEDQDTITIDNFDDNTNSS